MMHGSLMSGAFLLGEKSMPKPAPRFDRTTFTTPRTLEYFNEGELRQQLGVGPEKWPLSLTKELIDNALDACEADESRSPSITVTLDGPTITVEDNGPGLPEQTMRKSAEYETRTSDKAHYISPTRGQLGNALKCLWAAPFVYHRMCRREAASVEITTPEYAYDIAVTVDQIRQVPRVNIIEQERPKVKIGTIIKTEWPNVASFNPPESDDFYFEDQANAPANRLSEAPIRTTILNLLKDYATFNPHAAFCFRHEEETIEFPTIVDPDWEKWKTDYATSPHWYKTEDLRNLIAAFIANENESMTVRDFIKMFRGLTGSAKPRQVAENANLSDKGKCLGDMIRDGNIDLEMVESLRQAMCAGSQPVKGSKLGVIGEEALRMRLIEIDGAVPDGINYTHQISNDHLQPTVVEVAFGPREDDEQPTQTRYGLNFSPALNIPFRDMPRWLQADRLIEGHDAMCLIIHATRPRFEFESRAKAMLI
jgi:Histidine kinase-, DNA gyrase B-, and HSP90-like ATPase